MRGHADHHAAPNLSSNKRANWVFASTTRSEMVSNGTHCGRNRPIRKVIARAVFVEMTIQRRERVTVPPSNP